MNRMPIVITYKSHNPLPGVQKYYSHNSAGAVVVPNVPVQPSANQTLDFSQGFSSVYTLTFYATPQPPATVIYTPTNAAPTIGH